MTNARSIIEQALRKLHVVGRGQSLNADEAQDALTALNSLIGSFNAEGGVVTAQTRESFPMDGSESYTIGTGGDFDTAVPTDIIAAVVSSGDVDYILKELNPKGYESTSYKTINSIPEYYYYDNNRPLGNMFFWPRGDASYTLSLTSYKSLQNFADLTTDYSLAEGVERMLVYCLAEEIAPEYEKEASRSIMTKAMQAKEAVISRNKRFNYPTSDIDDVLSGGDSYNIYSGGYQ